MGLAPTRHGHVRCVPPESPQRHSTRARLVLVVRRFELLPVAGVGWRSEAGVERRVVGIDEAEPFCGRHALYISSSWALNLMTNGNGRSSTPHLEAGQSIGTDGYSVSDFPWMCSAFRLQVGRRGRAVAMW